MLGFRTKALTPEVRAELKEGDAFVYTDIMHHHGANLLVFLKDLTPDVVHNPPLNTMQYTTTLSRQYHPDYVPVVFLFRVYKRYGSGYTEKEVKLKRHHRLLTCSADEYLAKQKQVIKEKPTWDKKQKEIYDAWCRAGHRDVAKECAYKRMEYNDENKVKVLSQETEK